MKKNVALKKLLEWELSLDSRDMRSHAWFHGPLSRQGAEEIVCKEGDFLVRDCVSQPDNYVLTCRTASSVLHFVINKIIVNPHTVYEKVQYQFEDDAFDAVTDLITFYVGSGKPISAASGAKILYPCNRTFPLSYYGYKMAQNHQHSLNDLQTEKSKSLLHSQSETTGLCNQLKAYTPTNTERSLEIQSLFSPFASDNETAKIPNLEYVSKFDMKNFTTLLLPSTDTKPLEQSTLQAFKTMVIETSPKLIAEHILKIDVDLLLENSEMLYNSKNIEVCGLEMLTFTHAKEFRRDLIERTQCIKLMVAVSILTSSSEEERAHIICKWIQIAVETKIATGNLFSFCSIMLGLCMPQIQNLDSSWHTLRQKYTDYAFTFEATLKPTFISMNESSNPQAPNTTVPHVLIYALLKDRAMAHIISDTPNGPGSSLYDFCVKSWESKSDDFGMNITFLHLESGQEFLDHLDMYKKNASNVLRDSAARQNKLLLDAFRTEFHIKFLWGGCGAFADIEERYIKLEKVLASMAEKYKTLES